MNDEISEYEKAQRDIIAFLASPAAHGGAAPERVDTHLSHIFLTPTHAYKLKRAVDYGFVDFTSVEKRRRAAAREVELNRRTAPEIYLGVLPLYREAARVTWEGAGEPADYVVAMRRFDRALELDKLAESGKLSAPVIARLADRVAEFHARANRATNGDDMEALIRRLGDTMAADPMAKTRAGDIRRWRGLALDECARLQCRLDARARHGFVKRCHGDLHLGNIAMIGGEPTPFDAIEFDERLATIDVQYDLAFLLMDLARFHRADLSALALSRYLSVTRDYSGAGLLPLFQSMRAAVRAMVLDFPGEPADAHQAASGYLDLALSFLEQRRGARLIAVSGFSGSGKSRCSLALAPLIDAPRGAIIIQSDVVRKRMLGVSLETRLSEDAYSHEMSRRTYRLMEKGAARALGGGVPVILDATFLDAESRASAARLAKRMGVPFAGFQLVVEPGELRRRVASRRGDASDADVAVLERQLKGAAPPRDWTRIDAAGDPDEVARRIYAAL
ncbi:MAG: AAA family ATPase [Parvularculaceae bacterium]